MATATELKNIDATPGVPEQKKAVTDEEKLAEALFIAVGNNSIKLVEKLLDKGARTDWMHGKHTPLRLAAQRGFFPIVRMLHEQAGVSIKDDKRILHVTVLGDTCTRVMLDYLVAKGADVNHEDPTLGTPLVSALSKGKKHNQAASWLEELGAKRSGGTGLSPLHNATKKGDLATARSLLESGDQKLLEAKNGEGMVPLMVAAEHGHNALVKLFFEHGASPNETSAGYTPLFLAVQNGHVDTVDLLLTSKADPNAVDKERGAAPLHLAASNDYREVVELLLKHGANPDVATSDGLTPTHMAVSEGLTATVACLLEHKASVHQPDGHGRTPLQHGVMANHPWTVALLLQKGADADARVTDSDGVSPVGIVKEASLGHMAAVFTRFSEIDVTDKKTACGACMRAMEEKKRCGRCKALWYCSAECQRVHWSHHKTTCKKA